MNTCVINNIQTVSQDRLTFFTLGQKMKIALSLDFFGLYQYEGLSNSHIIWVYHPVV